MPDLDALESRAGSLSDADIRALAALLAEEDAPLPDRHRALLLLAQTHTPDAEHALHALLERAGDAALQSEALRTLCLRWRLAERYAGALRHFVRGVAWDTARGGELRRAAIAIAGELLAEQPHGELMLDLVRLSEESPDDATGIAAARALARATGYHGKHIDLL
jgi:hypothetical protein